MSNRAIGKFRVWALGLILVSTAGMAWGQGLDSGLLVQDRPGDADLQLRSVQQSLVGKAGEVADPPNGQRGIWARYWVATSLDHGAENVPESFQARHGSAWWVGSRYSNVELVLPYLVPGNRVTGVYKLIPIPGDGDVVMMLMRQFIRITDKDDNDIMLNGQFVADLANGAPLKKVSQAPTGVSLKITPGWVDDSTEG